MSYLQRVEIERKRNRVTEERRKAHQRQASKSGSRRVVPVEPIGGFSWRSLFDAVTGKAAAKICEKCGTRTTLKQLKKLGACPKCKAKS